VNTFVTAPKPPQPIERGLAGPGLLAYLIVSKYEDHLPLNRQEQIFARYGLDLSRSTMCDWLASCATLLEPLWREMKRQILLSQVLQGDDTPVPFLEEGRTATRKGYLWVYLGDWAHPYTLYEFTPGRTQEGPSTFLTGYRGYFQADAYSGYEALYTSGEILEVACWAHARRKFDEARASDPERAHRALGMIRQLYAVEKEAQTRARQLELSEAALWELRRQLRQEKALPIVTALCQWLKEERSKVCRRARWRRPLATF
jgi:hypothetical protein